MKSLLQTLFLFMLPLQFCFAQWVPTDSSLHNASCLATRGSNLYAGGGFYHFICVSTNNGDSWNSINSGFGTGMACAITFSGENIIVGTHSFTRPYYDGVFVSTDNGITWGKFLEVYYITSAVSNENNVFAGADGRGVFYSSDSGITWDTVNNGLTNRYIRKLAISGSKVFAGSAGDGVFLTTNNGMNWTQVNNGLSKLDITAFAVSGTYIFAGTQDGIFRTIDDGANWVAVNSGIPLEEENWVYDFAVVETNIFVSIYFNDGPFHSKGVYLSSNFGETWNDVSDGLPEEIWFISALTANETYLFAGNDITTGFFNCGVWRRPLSEMITEVDNDSKQLPDNFRLLQNYPNPLNPFNPSTTIKYSITQSSDVVIKVFDVLGNEIEELLNEEKPSGTYEITWYAENLPSGVYFYRIQAGDFTQAKKMVLMK